MASVFRPFFPVLLLGGLFLLSGCEDDFGERCKLPAKVRDACRADAVGSSGLESHINCIMEENLDCSSKLCVVYQDSEPFCSQTCTSNSDCPGDARCETFLPDEDADRYCVIPKALPAQ